MTDIDRRGMLGGAIAAAGFMMSAASAQDAGSPRRTLDPVTPRKPRLAVPPGAWDTHFHLLGPAEKFPYTTRPENLFPRASLEEYLDTASILGFERGVFVQGNFHVGDPRIVLDAVNRTNGRLRGMLVATPDMKHWNAKELYDGGIRGVRFEVRRLPADYDVSSLRSDVEWVVGKGWVASLHVDPDALMRLAEPIRKFPGPIVIENFALVDARLGANQPAVAVLLELAREPHIWLKTASAFRMMLRGGLYADMRAIARAVHAASPDRTIWGTEWPHPNLLPPAVMPNDGDLVDTLLDFVPDETGRYKLLVTNPYRLFEEKWS